MPRVEIETKDAVIAMGFVIGVIIAVALVSVGIITNPMTLGILVTMTIAMVFLGYIMQSKGILSKTALPLWFIFSFGLVMILYGAIYAGYLPIAFSYGASVKEVALSNALFYTLIATAVAGAVLSVFFGYKYYTELRK